MGETKHIENDDPNSALKVNPGIPQPPVINSSAADRIIRGKNLPLRTSEYLAGIKAGDRAVLAKAITLVESSLPAHQEKAQEIIAACLPLSGKSVRIGITGVPGVGKSTFIEAFGKYLTGSGHKVAVLAVDPSSSRSKGSILGDKTRMEELANDPNAFIRPSPSAGSLGGVARKTRETIVLCEAAGFDCIIIETVGVGQSEVLAHSMVDFFLLLMLAGAGDELQGIKRGIMEMADAIIINKADGDNLPKVTIALSEIRNALHYFAPSPSGWVPVAGSCSAITKTGIHEVWQIIRDYLIFTQRSGYFVRRRNDQNLQFMIQAVEQGLLDRFYHNKDVKLHLQKLQNDLKNNKISAFVAAMQLLQIYFEENSSSR